MPLPSPDVAWAALKSTDCVCIVSQGEHALGPSAEANGIENERMDKMSLQKAASLSDLSPDEIVGIDIDGMKVALYLVDGEVVATSDLCTHEECPLSEEGEIAGDQVSCLCHGSKFNVRTGEVLNPPATEPLPVYKVEVRGQDVWVDIG
jgi:nitrite reductase/ring-hydroxylating ferredoxin subunit